MRHRLAALAGPFQRIITENDMLTLAQQFPKLAICFRPQHLERGNAFASYFQDMDAGPGAGILFWGLRTRVIDVEHELRHRVQDEAGQLDGSPSVYELAVAHRLSSEFPGLPPKLRAEVVREIYLYLWEDQ